MNLEAAKLAAADNLWTAILPELMLGCIALLLIWRHRENIVRIVRGAEPRLGDKKV